MTGTHDPLTDPAVPRLGLSLSVILVIALGGALGTLARFLLGTTFVEGSSQVPTVTLVINLSGSLAIGLLVPLVERWMPHHPLPRPFLIVGVLGGWTTYSALAVSAVTLLQNGHVATSVLYLAATLVGGTALLAVGSAVGRRLSAP
jgi:CrcB protein